MSEAIELYKKDGTAAGIFYCSECRIVHKTEAEATNCHGKRLCACGKAIEHKYQSDCTECRSKQWREQEAIKERERFDAAVKINVSDYKGDMVNIGDKFYEEIEDAIDQFLPGQEPEYVWACKNVGVPLADSDSIVENCLEGMWEDADARDLNGLAELDAALAAFNEANRSIRVFQPDYTTAILTTN